MKYQVTRVTSNGNKLTLLPITNVYADSYTLETANNMGMDSTQLDFFVAVRSGWFDQHVEKVRITSLRLIGDFMVTRES